MEQVIGKSKLELLKNMCHQEVFKRIPSDRITEFGICHGSDGSGRRRTAVLLRIDACSYSGYATCSMQDNFCRRTGRELALKRAIRAYWDVVKEKAGQN